MKYRQTDRHKEIIPTLVFSICSAIPDWDPLSCPGDETSKLSIKTKCTLWGTAETYLLRFIYRSSNLAIIFYSSFLLSDPQYQIAIGRKAIKAELFSWQWKAYKEVLECMPWINMKECFFSISGRRNDEEPGNLLKVSGSCTASLCQRLENKDASSAPRHEEEIEQ